MFKLLTLCVFFLLSASSFAEGEGAGNSQIAARNIAKSVESTIDGYFSDIDTLLGSKELITALSAQDHSELQSLAASFEKQLRDSLKVRIFIKGNEQPDYENSPACGYACVDNAIQAYSKPVKAEAIMYKSADASIVLARPIMNKDGESLGAIVVQYPYSILKDAMSASTDSGQFIEFRQYVAGKKLPLIQQGDKSIRTQEPHTVFDIDNTRWSIAVWTPGGIQADEITLQSFPWTMIIVIAAAVLIGIVILIVVLKKKSAGTRDQTDKSGHPVEDEEEKGPRTIVFGGGAADVDVSDYLSNKDITEIKKK